MNRFHFKLAQVLGGASGRNDQLFGSGGQRSRPLDTELRFGDLAEASFSTASVE